MKEKIELRKKLKSISLVNLVHSSHVIEKLNSYIKNKIVCTYIPLNTEININNHLLTQSLLTTTAFVDNQLKICNLQEPLEINKFGVYQPVDLNFVDKVDIFIVPGLGFDIKGNRLGKGSGIYDKILSEFKYSTLFGVTDVNHIVDFIPYEKHDISMDALITHDEIIEINL